MKTAYRPTPSSGRQAALIALRNLKMARSAHAYVRGNTIRFYQWLESLESHTLPDGPPIWICGDCHVGNLGPISNAQGHVEIQIRDLDQTVVGNPVHDLIRLGLSLATAARGSDLSGVVIATMMEQMMEGYERAFDTACEDAGGSIESPESARVIMRQAWKRTWKNLARDRIENTKPTIPLGKSFWPLSREEKRAVKQLFADEIVARLATLLRSRDEGASVKVLDAAYWVKGCSSLGRLRVAVLLDVGRGSSSGDDLCLMDIKEAIQAAAPRYPAVRMPRDNGERIVEGARHLAPFLGERMRASRFLDRSVFLRELLPQDLKVEINQLTHDEAMKVARFLALVVGKAHARQMDGSTRESWQRELQRNRSKKLDAPTWLWTSIVELVSRHERGYLEHCRRYAMDSATR
ncbi:DUF2252 domain-containing protein [Paraburkholderia tagetis]|uniref:DUF2252 domain-containing protein n=1 Tax=Paraburkholderia tagetis TaxID=2913261 RepID=A0A9X1RWU0_9BURK|nr:DUF2252 domain-containing protein [Paraburkholderia tagetis]MCG5076549.1 DUF2252 domain-containing protein [Paraburkholderia tagetis]